MKKNTLANVSLLLGVVAFLLPMFYGFGNALLIIIFGKPVLYILSDVTLFAILFSVIVVLSVAFSLVGLIVKPRPIRKETVKMVTGLLLTVVSVLLLVQILLSKN